jgi:hypothetical protein
MPIYLLAIVGKGLNRFRTSPRGNSYTPMHFLFQSSLTFTWQGRPQTRRLFHSWAFRCALRLHSISRICEKIVPQA